MIPSQSVPTFANIPGMTYARDSWSIRQLDGFKRVQRGRQRPMSASASFRQPINSRVASPEHAPTGLYVNGSQHQQEPVEYAQTYAQTFQDEGMAQQQQYKMQSKYANSTQSAQYNQNTYRRPATASDTGRRNRGTQNGNTSIQSFSRAPQAQNHQPTFQPGFTSPVRTGYRNKEDGNIARQARPMSAHGNGVTSNYGEFVGNVPRNTHSMSPMNTLKPKPLQPRSAAIVAATSPSKAPDLPYLVPQLDPSRNMLGDAVRPVFNESIVEGSMMNDDGATNTVTELDVVQTVRNTNKQTLTKSAHHNVNYMTEAAASKRGSERAKQLKGYIDESKVVCRYEAFFKEDRVWDRNTAIGNPVIESEIVRNLQISYYVIDGTFSIFEKKICNTGLAGGHFLKRSKIVKDDDDEAKCLTVFDLIPGSSIRILGLEIFIVDADRATRNFLIENFDFHLPEKTFEVAKTREDIGVHRTLGFGGRTFPPRDTNTFPPTYDFYQRKEQIMKTKRFLYNDARPLRFDCIELNDRDDSGALDTKLYHAWKHQCEKSKTMKSLEISNSIRKACLTYYIPDYCVEVTLGYWPNQVVKDREDPLILKRSKLQRNWRDATKGKKRPEFFEPRDFTVGKITDLYGRYYLLCACSDQYTQSYYSSMGVNQIEIPVEIETVPPIIQSIPKSGDGFLAIGKPEDTLATVYGQSQKKQVDPNRERNIGRTMKSRAKLVSSKPEDQMRLFSITFYLEDNTLSIYEEVVRNSGCVGGTFLSRGRYTNYLPFDGNDARYFMPKDMFMGNVLSINKVEMQIIEMDGASLKFCEQHPDEFPMSDTFEILMKILDKVIENATNVRKVCKDQDRAQSGTFDKQKFIQLLDSLYTTQDGSTSVATDSMISDEKMSVLNDQEILTILRRFHDNHSDLYHYDEMCDLFSHIYYVRDMNKRAITSSNVLNSLDEVRQYSRPNQTQWRRVLRKDKHAWNGLMSASHFIRMVSKLGMNISEEGFAELSSKYAVEDREAQLYIAAMNKITEMEDKQINETKKTQTQKVRTTSEKASETVGSVNRLYARKSKAQTIDLDGPSTVSITIQDRRKQIST